MTQRHTFHLLEAYISTEMLLAETPKDPVFLLGCLYDQLNKDSKSWVELEFAFRGNAQPLLDRLIPLMPHWDNLYITKVYDSFLIDSKWKKLFESYLNQLIRKAECSTS